MSVQNIDYKILTAIKNINQIRNKNFHHWETSEACKEIEFEIQFDEADIRQIEIQNYGTPIISAQIYNKILDQKVDLYNCIDQKVLIRFDQMYEDSIQEKYWKIFIQKPDIFKEIKHTFMTITLKNPFFNDFKKVLGLGYLIIGVHKYEDELYYKSPIKKSNIKFYEKEFKMLDDKQNKYFSTEKKEEVEKKNNNIQEKKNQFKARVSLDKKIELKSGKKSLTKKSQAKLDFSKNKLIKIDDNSEEELQFALRESKLSFAREQQTLLNNIKENSTLEEKQFDQQKIYDSNSQTFDIKSANMIRQQENAEFIQRYLKSQQRDDKENIKAQYKMINITPKKIDFDFFNLQ